MSFTCDKQTLDDLNLLGKYKPGSIYSLFNGTHTRGGEKLLESLFREPLTDPAAINHRSGVFRFAQHRMPEFPLAGTALDLVETYLGAGSGGNLLTAFLGTARKKVSASVLKDEAFGHMKEGLLATIAVLERIRVFMEGLGETEDHPFRAEVARVREIFEDTRLAWVREVAAGPGSSVAGAGAVSGTGSPAPGTGTPSATRRDGDGSLPWPKIASYDHLLRNTLHREMQALMDIIHHLDVAIAVGRTAAARGLSYAHALAAEDNTFGCEALWHPAVENAVTNPLGLDGSRNMLFLTGANMAGKSTFMKAFGISVYLAHMGFPVAASEMTFSVKDGLYSSINVPDNLSLGYSHFYAEVLRVKNAAEEVARGKNMVVIFDELFKGTNVKDAYDATLAVTASFAEYRNCLFIISTHIIEVGEALRAQCENLQFAYLPTVMEGVRPRYTFRMEEGITTDRHGMMIIENEKILELI